MKKKILIKKGFKSNIISSGIIFIDWRQETKEDSSSSSEDEIENIEQLDQKYSHLAKGNDKQTEVFEDLKRTANKYKNRMDEMLSPGTGFVIVSGNHED